MPSEYFVEKKIVVQIVKIARIWSNKMTENDLNYGNFAEPKEEKTSKRSEDVLLTAIERCEKLENQLKLAIKCLKGLYVWADTGNGGENAIKMCIKTTLDEIKDIK